MKLAIHNGTDKKVSWNTKWIDYCQKNNIPYIGVNCYDPNIIEILRENEVTHLMWAFSLALPKDSIVAKSVLNSANMMGIKTFPNFNSNWHFEDKVAQKYMLEAIEAPVVKSWTFFDKESAIDFIEKTKLPIVAKLRKGAGSENVVLLHTISEAKKYINTMFEKGVIPSQSAVQMTKDKISAIKKGKVEDLSYSSIRRKIGTLLTHINRRKNFTKEIGYVYFQEFLPNNINDLRIAVVNNRVWGFYRGVRKNDFRASGSGIIDYETPLPLEVVEDSLKITKKLGTQSLCFDYVKDNNGKYKIVEVCYGYVSEVVAETKGYYDENMIFHNEKLFPHECILLDFINS